MIALVAATVIGQLTTAPALPTEPANLPAHLLEGQAITIPNPEKELTVLIFTSVDCPIANRYTPEFRKLNEDFKDQVTFYRVYADPYVSKEDMIRHGTDFNLPLKGIYDEGHRILRFLGATVTPEATVIKKDGTVTYRGRVTDLYLEHGRTRTGEAREDLRIAIEETLAGQPVTMPITIAKGCYIIPLEDD